MRREACSRWGVPDLALADQRCSDKGCCEEYTPPSTPTPAPTPSPTTVPSTAPTTVPSTAPTTVPTPEPTPTPFVCPIDDIARTKCMGPKDCLYPLAGVCDKFIACEINPDGVTGRPTVKDCPPGLEWNDNEKYCDSPVSSTCVKPTPQPFICPTEDIARTHCMGATDCVYPFVGNCSQYIQCVVNAGGVTGRPIVMDCPAGLEWNDNNKICVSPVSSTCPKPTPTPTRPTRAPTPIPTLIPFVCPLDDIARTNCSGPTDCLYPFPGNCIDFIVCLVEPDGSGLPMVKECPVGLEWNDNKKICDLPISSTCSKLSQQPT
ncbi:unnamed protein product [Medioppia subpectinata]|uniref:Chitin-binding type-2 domain-containing protein n=1 Tax=Medioppia subpectinata TaxID=1979941 RepID=A0A7R9PUK5_9ACAR|nr:unnamed protein product [Medioppia subpectinata]CAG2100874.1 unnamed protein product [Medioppia subpectinata]